MNNSEGQTQEPVGGMPLFHNEDANVYIDRAIAMLKEEYEDNPFTAGYNGIVSLLGYAKESHTASIAPPPAPIKTEGEDWQGIAKTIILSIDHYRQSGRDEIFNLRTITDYLERCFSAPPSPVGIDVEAEAKKYAGIKVPLRVKDYSAATKRVYEAFKAGYAAKK